MKILNSMAVVRQPGASRMSNCSAIVTRVAADRRGGRLDAPGRVAGQSFSKHLTVGIFESARSVEIEK